MTIQPFKSEREKQTNKKLGVKNRTEYIITVSKLQRYNMRVMGIPERKKQI